LASKYKGWGNKIVWEDYSTNPYQLGAGIYMTPDFAGYPGINPDKAYDCAILAGSDAWDNLNKVFVPATMNEQCPKPLFWRQGGQ
jgi:hypothetical protein